MSIFSMLPAMQQQQPTQTTKGVPASPSVQNSPHLGGGSMGPQQGPALGQALASRTQQAAQNRGPSTGQSFTPNNSTAPQQSGLLSMHGVTPPAGTGAPPVNTNPTPQMQQMASHFQGQAGNLQGGQMGNMQGGGMMSGFGGGMAGGGGKNGGGQPMRPHPGQMNALQSAPGSMFNASPQAGGPTQPSPAVMPPSSPQAGGYSPGVYEQGFGGGFGGFLPQQQRQSYEPKYRGIF